MLHISAPQEPVCAENLAVAHFISASRLMIIIIYYYCIGTLIVEWFICLIVLIAKMQRCLMIVDE